MRVFFSALVLYLMLLINEIEASGLRRIKTKTSRNDPEGVHTPSLGQHALDSGEHQSHYPQPFYPENNGYPHPQEYLNHESSPEASGLRRVSTSPYQNDGVGIDHLATSRVRKQSVATPDPTSVDVQALDLDGHQSYPPQSFHQQFNENPAYAQVYFHPLNPAEVVHVVKKFSFKNGRFPELDQTHLAEDMTINNQIHHPQPEDSQANLEHDNIEWLLGAYHKSPYYLPPGYIQYGNTDELDQKSSEQAEKIQERAASLLNKKLIQKERQKLRNALKKPDAMGALNAREAALGNPPATTEIGRRVKGKAASGRDVSGPHDQIIQPSQKSEHDFRSTYPILIPKRMSGFNPYVEFPGNDHNILPDDLNQWDHPGGSGTGSHQ